MAHTEHAQIELYCSSRRRKSRKKQHCSHFMERHLATINGLFGVFNAVTVYQSFSLVIRSRFNEKQYIKNTILNKHIYQCFIWIWNVKQKRLHMNYYVKLCFLQYEHQNGNLKQCGLAFKQKTRLILNNYIKMQKINWLNHLSLQMASHI